jgi:hypothetical protein
MSQTTTVRTERIELRAKREIKSIIERAAQLRHTTISAYFLETALHRALFLSGISLLQKNVPRRLCQAYIRGDDGAYDCIDRTSIEAVSLYD